MPEGTYPVHEGRALRSRLPRWLLSIVLLLLFALLGYQLWLSHEDQIRTAEISTRNLAAIFETRLEATLRRTDADLIALGLEIPPEALLKENVPLFQQEMSNRLNGRLFNVERSDGFHVFDVEGDALYSSDAVPAHRMNVADREYFRRLRDDPQGLVFSEVVTSRISGRDILVLARALRDAHGTFLGVVINPIDLDHYRQQFSSVNLGQQGVISLVRSDTHARVVRWPEMPGGTNQPLPPDHPAVSRLPAPGGEVTLLHDVDAVHPALIMSLKTMRTYPFYFAVGVGRDEILAGWYAQVRLVGVSILLIAGLVGVLLFRLGRMRQREAGILTDLAQSERQYTKLAQAVPVGIAHFDREGRHTYVNDRYLLLTGRSREALIGRTWSEVVDPEDSALLRATWGQILAAGDVAACEFRLVRPDGVPVHVFGEAKTETAPDGTLIGYFTALTDITQRKQAEAELLVAKQQAESANLAKTRFLAAASHDLRQPIQAINLFSDALGRTPLNEEQQSIARYLTMSVRLLGELLYSLLDISKLEAGLVKPQMQPVSVEDLLKVIDAEFSPLACERRLRFKLFYPFASPVLMTDSALLLSVLRNLVDNAFKYTEKGGVLVGVRRHGERALIQVWDTGVGIDPRYGDQLFEECFQVGNPMRDRTKGLGIGLAIARRTARLLGGDVIFHSRPGRGSVFEVSLPLADASDISMDDLGDTEAEDGQWPGGAAGEDASLLAGWRVVVVEDDPVVAKSVEFSLQSLGIDVSVFQDAEKALASPAIAAADFYVTDFSMPGMNGLQLLAAIKQRVGHPIDAVLITGETSPERIRQASDAHWPVLFKPAELSGLLAVMNRAARRRARGVDAPSAVADLP
ncbi:ATP-binding protein [Propionivibrio limicola]|uniref:ATP-binding protein n=1 Tax=Propionivibrio limicola TaxID=167645 RepID=UPI0012921D37|nr:ATP-binding protein [Propionivibrio limicola]